MAGRRVVFPRAPRALLALLALLALPPASLADTTVSILDNLGGFHSCVKYCLYGYNVYSDMGSALQCGRPYANACYCATGTVQASRAVSWVTACASKSCSAGDLDLDVSAMQSQYAQYCSAAGFLQPMITDWLSADAAAPSETAASDGDGGGGGQPPSPGSTGDNDQPHQTTRVTVVTQTTGSDPESGATRAPGGSGTLDILEATSTLWVDPNGNVVSGSSGAGSHAGSSVSGGLIAGLAVGIGVPLLALGGLAFFCCLRRRNNRPVNPHPALPPMAGVSTAVPPPPPSVSPPTTTSTPVAAGLARKPIPIVETTAHANVPVVPNAELSGQHVTREADGTEIHVFPGITPKSPVRVPGTHEMETRGHRQLSVSVLPPPQGGGGFEMATEGHAPITTFEMPVQGHQPPRGVEMATEGHEPVTTFEMGGGARSPMLGARSTAHTSSPLPWQGRQQTHGHQQGGGFY